MTITRIAAEVGVDRKTVSKWLADNTLPSYKPRTTKTSKLEAFKTYILQRMEEVLSAAKTPKKDGRGYLYPVRGKSPFTETFMTNGRKAILSMLGDRCSSELIYR